MLKHKGRAVLIFQFVKIKIVGGQDFAWRWGSADFFKDFPEFDFIFKKIFSEFDCGGNKRPVVFAAYSFHL